MSDEGLYIFVIRNVIAGYLYRLVGEFYQCGYKFGRWYNMVWMEKMIGEHRNDQPAMIPFPEIGDRIG